MVGQLVIDVGCRGDEGFMGTEFSCNGRTLGGAIVGRCKVGLRGMPFAITCCC